MNLTALDILVIAVPLIVVLLVSLYLRKYMRSVADFLAASRCAGRYIISTAGGETGSSVIVVIAALEVFSRAGFSLRFWESISSFLFFFFGLLGLIVYRFRETRALTFHQFFEIRYSKGVRVFASFLNVLSGLFNFGIQPAVGARFFVYFCGLPEHWTVGPFTLPTFVPLMLILMAMSLFFALTGGQISVMVTDCLEGIISSFFYLVIAFFIVCTISVSQMRDALLSGPAGASFVDPFAIGGRDEFNGWYILFAVLLSTYYYRGNAWQQGFVASARNAHEGRMAGVLANWRAIFGTSMTILIGIGGFTLLHNADFAAQQAQVAQGLQGLSSSQLATQMAMPTALGVLFAPGIKGAFCAILLFGLLASQGAQLHGFGATIMQDVILPLRRKPFAPKAHVRALKAAIFCVAVFVCAFSIIFKPVDYLVMVIALIGAIYLGGIGLVCWGGLYWKKGTTAGAWTALATGATLGIGFNLVQQFWPQLNPVLIRLAGPGGWAGYLAAHAEKCPLNGQQLSLITAATAAAGYVIVSLLTCRRDFNMDEMLHRGKYRIASEDIAVEGEEAGTALGRFLQIDRHFTRGDKVLTFATFGWTLLWMAIPLGIVLWTLFVGRLSTEWWFNYTMVVGVWLTIVLGVVMTIWFTIGVSHDMKDLFSTLKTVRRIDTDDGTVRGHHNTGEAGLLSPEAKDERRDDGPAGKA